MSIDQLLARAMALRLLAKQAPCPPRRFEGVALTDPANLELTLQELGVGAPWTGTFGHECSDCPEPEWAERTELLLEGDAVRLSVRTQFAMYGVYEPPGRRRWMIAACACDLCELGRHVLLDDGRHVARAAIVRVGALESFDQPVRPWEQAVKSPKRGRGQ